MEPQSTFRPVVVTEGLKEARADYFEERPGDDIRGDDLIVADYFESLSGGGRRRKTYGMAP